jgi:hypothetical protein
MKKVTIDSDLLTPRDMKRARVALNGRDPWEVMNGEREDRAVLIAWCLLSRDDPTITFEQLEEMPFGEFIEVEDEEGGSEPPPTPEPVSSGTGLGESSNGNSNKTPAAAEPALNSSSSTG